MAQGHDVAIVGLGAMGSAAAYHLARRGQRVLGLDHYRPPHEQGSSHGQTRIIREAYFEHPLYVPLVQRAYGLWEELEQAANQKLFIQTGGLMIGPQDGELVQGAAQSARIHDLTYEMLTADEIRARFPALRPSDKMVAVWEPRAGALFPEACITAHLALARESGATLRFEEPAVEWEADGSGVQVTTALGRYRAGQLLLTPGAWLGGLVPELALPLTVERQVLYWFQPAAHSGAFRPANCPIYIWQHAPDRYFYGFPDLGQGVKVARHYEGEFTNPDALRREVSEDEAGSMRDLLRVFMPGANGALLRTAVCMYTNTPDLHFAIGTHPGHPQVWIAGAFSGHGFKFSSAIGELMADLLITGETPHNINLFRLERLATER
jgi:sarcosine oxidase